MNYLSREGNKTQKYTHSVIHYLWETRSHTSGCSIEYPGDEDDLPQDVFLSYRQYLGYGISSRTPQETEQLMSKGEGCHPLHSEAQWAPRAPLRRLGYIDSLPTGNVTVNTNPKCRKLPDLEVWAIIC